MYQDHFQLRELPFTLTPNTLLYFNQYSHREALNTMLLAIRHSEGFVKITGEVGTGKTLLSRLLLDNLGESFKTAYVSNPYLSPDELKQFIAEELGIDGVEELASYKLLGKINRELVSLAESGRQVVLIVDEAQAMPRETIEALRLLTNLETEQRKLLQVVLIGQPELDELLARDDLRQLKQRIVFSEKLLPLSAKATANYIRFRVSTAGGHPKIFSKLAMKLIAMASGGVPRLINILAHKSLLSAYGKGEDQVSAIHVAKAIADTEESRWAGKLCGWPFIWGAAS